MAKSSTRLLIYGYGNPGRQDDALGIQLCDEIEKWNLQHNINNIAIDQNYQLNIEDAEVISNYDVVIFVDASVNEIKTYQFDELKPDMHAEFSMHSVSPAFVLGLCQQIYNRFPESYQLQIKGYEWEFMKPVSSNAMNNLFEAGNFLKSFIKNKIGIK